MKRYTCCFTGHRDLKREELPIIGQKIERAILKCLELGIYRFENGMALGFDILAALHVLRLQEFHPEIELHLMIPCRDQCRKWTSRQELIYRDILARATSVTYLSNTYYDGCMRVRNYRMVDDSCACICCYDKTRARGSGTAQTVRYAEKSGLLILNCLPDPDGNTNRSYFDL